MHKILITLLLLLSLPALSQVPQQFNFQSVATVADVPITDQEIAVQASLNNASETFYVEQHLVATDASGQYSIPVGGGTLQSGMMESVLWEQGGIQLTLEIDPDGGSAFELSAIVMLQAVPYAFYAPNGETGPTGDDGNDGANGVDGQTGPLGNTGQNGYTGPSGNNGASGVDGEKGFSCYDLNQDMLEDPEEDCNGDGIFNFADCLASQQWQSSGSNIYLLDANVGIGTDQPQEALHVVGNICHTGSSSSCSDVRYKKDFQNLSSALEAVMQLNGVTYQWKSADFKEKAFDDKEQIGVIAQDIRKLFPELVKIDSDGFLSVDYSRISIVLLEAMKEQRAAIAEIESKNEKLREFIINRLANAESKVLEAGSTQNK